MDLVCRIRVPDDELAVLRRGDEMAAIGGPVHGVDFGEVTFEGALGLEVESGKLFCSLAGHLAYYYRLAEAECAGASEGIRVVSPSSSFLRFILSFKPSASRRAICILCCSDSALTSVAILGSGTEAAAAGSMVEAMRTEGGQYERMQSDYKR